MKIIAASDMHIGYEFSNRAKISEFLDKVYEEKPDLFVLNGDIIDLWRMGFKQIRKENFINISKINNISKTIPTVWVKGNHDISVPEKAFPDIMFADTFFEFGKFHFEHGHLLDSSIAKYAWIFKYIPVIFPKFYQIFLAKHEKVIEEDYGIGWYEMHDKAKAFIMKHDMSVIIGHSHAPQVKELSGRYMGDSGDFIDSCSYLVIDDNTVRLERI